MKESKVIIPDVIITDYNSNICHPVKDDKDLLTRVKELTDKYPVEVISPKGPTLEDRQKFIDVMSDPDLDLHTSLNTKTSSEVKMKQVKSRSRSNSIKSITFNPINYLK